MIPKIMMIICLICLIVIFRGLVLSVIARIKKKKIRKKLSEQRSTSQSASEDNYFDAIVNETMKNI